MKRNTGFVRLSVSSITVVALLGACTPGEKSGSGGQGGGQKASKAGQAALSPEAYREALTAAGEPVGSAMGEVARARSVKNVARRLGEAHKAAGQALDRLRGVTPPQEFKAEHDGLVDELQRYHTEIASVREAADGREVCAPSSALGRLGGTEAAAGLRKAAAALGAKAGRELPLRVPAAAKEKNRRLAHGQALRRPGNRGLGELTVDNGNAKDAVVTLTRGKKTAFTFYVHKKRKFKLTGIPDGNYRLFFTSGGDWDPKYRGFTRDCSFEKFDEPFPFKTTATAYDTWSITLHAVSDGKAETSEAEPDDFPS
ncbi:hypothetical protein [Bailinhaonella thermotolerans]|uniref:Uncharacterized protein n=1 Tax=Bailinhaonella thermotolerans TaxID=1070861 RepID=A0A3A4B325_9ACTN|nr:hypothetical protein [Bailinhaonella thermotolerans]RJL32575.1 hypothetical protein D5H75_13725 [Bailinhaonella thermotolerans]